MATDKRHYAFSWDFIGQDPAVSRPGLGPSLRIEVYRLFQFTLRDVLEQRYGTDVADDMFREAGKLAGKAFYERFCAQVEGLPALVRTIQERFTELGIGIFRVEEADLDSLRFTLTVDEDLDCSGLPDVEHEICIYDEGFIAGILEAFTGKPFEVREIDCWCTGARTCRFRAVVLPGQG